MLEKLYGDLVRSYPDEGAFLFGVPIDCVKKSWLLVDEFGSPSILFASDRGQDRSDIELRSIRVQFCRDCNISLPEGKAYSGIFTIVTLLEGDQGVIWLFLRLIEQFFISGRSHPSNKQIAQRISELAELFRDIGSAQLDTVGLWGELYVIYNSEDIDSAIECWCQDKYSKYDFITEFHALEVKTTLCNERRHRFSYAQLRPNADFAVYVASILIAEAAAGKTVARLIDDICNRAGSRELKDSFYKQCVRKGGKEIYADLRKFVPYPSNAMLICDAKDIPVPKIEHGSLITNVKFDVQLSSVSAVGSDTRSKILRF